MNRVICCLLVGLVSLPWACSDEDTTGGSGEAPDVGFPLGDASEPGDTGTDDGDGGISTGDADGSAGARDASKDGGTDGDGSDGTGDSGGSADGGGTDDDGGGIDGDGGTVCVPDCTGKECGPDGCGGTCGPPCPDGQGCGADGTCAPGTEPFPACGGEGHFAYTNAGCDFWAVDLRNAELSEGGAYLNAQIQPFAVVVSNTSQTWTVDVTLTEPSGTVHTASVPGQSLHVFQLPPDNGIEGTGRTNSAYRIESNGVIVAYQFNPLDNVDVFSNDASVLLPAAEQGTEYFVMNLQHFHPGGTNYEFPGYVTVVGASELTAEVTITPTTSTVAGGDIPALAPGAPYTFTLDQGEVVNIDESAGDLTGTHIVTTAPVMVFSGHVAGRPDNNTCCSDHLEQQMPPVSRWGTEVIMGRSVKRDQELDHYRVVASRDNTTVTITEGAGSTSISLSKGGFHSFTADSHVVVSADFPVLVAQFLASAYEVSVVGPCETAADCGQAYVCECFSGSNCAQTVCVEKICDTESGVDECGPGYTCMVKLSEPQDGPACYPLGDPAMILGVPTEQWQDTFVFLAPEHYEKDYVNVVGPSSATLILDGTPVPVADFEVVSGTNYQVYRAEISDGVHTLQASEPVSLVVYGYDGAVSYGYPGALGLKELDQPQ